MENHPQKLFDQVRDVIRVKHDTLDTEQPYDIGSKKYLLFHNKRHPNELVTSEVQSFQSHPAILE